MKERQKEIRDAAPQEAPQPKEEETLQGFDPAPLLARIEELENNNVSYDRKIKHLESVVKFVKETNWFLIAVLSVGFIALVVTAILTFSSTFSDYTNGLDSLRTDRYQFQQQEYQFQQKELEKMSSPSASK